MISKGQNLTCGLLLLAGGLTGCVEGELELADAADEDAEAIGDGVDELAEDNGARPYVGWPYPDENCQGSYNVIGVLDDPVTGYCNLAGILPGTWAWKQMFADGNPELAATTSEPLPNELARYCLYEYVGVGTPDVDDYTALYSAIDAYPGMPLSSVSPDCLGEAVQGQGLGAPEVSAQLHQAFRQAVQWVSGTMLGSAAANRRPIAIYIVDTVSEQAYLGGLTPVNKHGLYMRRIIEEIACPDGDPACTGHIHHRMAMPRVPFMPGDYVLGGNWGASGDVAMGVAAAVRLHREKQLLDPSAPKRMVIVLSLGWGGPNAPAYADDPSRGSQQALLTALKFASCEGALIFAAAGNVSNPACAQEETGYLWPAGYELVAAPDGPECTALGFEALDPLIYPPIGNDRSLVNAVAGLDGRDQAIPNARPGAMAALASYAANVVIESQPGGFEAPLTGSSVSAAILGGMVGLIWSYEPTRTPDEVVQAIYGSSYETQVPADFGFDGAYSAVQRVSVCGALAEFCVGIPGDHCPTLECPDPSPPVDGYLSGFFTEVADALADPLNTVKVLPGGPGEVPMCSPPSWNEQGEPQPDRPACDNCGMEVAAPGGSGDDLVSMTINSEYQGSINSVGLTTWDAAGTPTKFSFNGDVVTSLNDPATAITQVYVEAPNAVSAMLTFDIDGSSQDNNVPVSQL